MGIIRFIKTGTLTITFLALTNIVFSNDTIKLSRPIPIFKLKGTVTNGQYFINKKNILVPQESNLFDYLNTEKLISNEIVFANSSFDDLADFVYLDQGFKQLHKNLYFGACKINNLFLKRVDTCKFEFGTIKNLNVESVSVMWMHQIKLLENLSIDNCKNLSLGLLSFSNSGKLEINISNSSINSFTCGPDRFDSSLVINFDKDTIKENIYITNNQYRFTLLTNSNPIGINYNRNYEFIIHFKNCYFDGEFN